MRRRALKKRPFGRLNPVWDSVFKNGAKETRTPDPLHALQVLFSSKRSLQLAYQKSKNILEQNLEHACCDGGLWLL